MTAALLPAFLALLASLLFAGADLFVRLGLKSGTPYSGVVVGASVHLVLFSLILAASPPEVPLKAPGVFWFLLAGVANPGLSLIGYFISLRQIGIARAASIVSSAPLFGVAMAIAFLGERPGWTIGTGTLLIVGGVMMLVGERSGRGVRGLALAVPLGSALLFGVAPLLRKMALGHIPSPAFGVAVASLAALVTFLLLSPLVPSSQRWSLAGRALPYFIGGGLIGGVANWIYFTALTSGAISVVVPLTFTQPLFNIALAALFLKDLEKTTGPLLWGALLVVGGAALITASQPP